MTIVLAIGLTDALSDADRLIWRSKGLFLNTASTPGRAIERLRDEDVDIVLMGGSLGAETRSRLIFEIRRFRPSIPVVYVSREPADSDESADSTVPANSQALLQEITRLAGANPRARIVPALLPFLMRRPGARHA
jgi:DNA-binding NarL/FixJ family response regulator